MTKRDKNLKRLENNPADVSFEEISKLLISNGFCMRRPRGGSSHATFCKGNYTITVPFSKPVKRVYVKHATELIRKSNEGETDQ